MDFCIHQFLAYLEAHIVGFSGCDGGYLREMTENLVAYGRSHMNGSKDQLIYFLKDIMPELECGEIAMFASDMILTAPLRREKQEWIEKTHTNDSTWEPYVDENRGG